MKKQGMYWHVHHSQLVEYCYDYDERVRMIKRSKPRHEIADRLRLMQPVKGSFPKALIKASLAYRKVYDAYMKEHFFAWFERRLWKQRDRAEKLIRVTMEAYEKEIEKLHAEECPDCIWDGREMIFKR